MHESPRCVPPYSFPCEDDNAKKKDLALALFATYHDSMLWKLESRFQEIVQSQFHAQDLLSKVAAFVSKSEE